MTGVVINITLLPWGKAFRSYMISRILADIVFVLNDSNRTAQDTDGLRVIGVEYSLQLSGTGSNPAQVTSDKELLLMEVS